MSDTTPQPCEVIVSERAHPGDPQCGQPAMMRYPAMGGGYMHLCDVHGAKHARIVDQFGERWNGREWQARALVREKGPTP